jgi:hypothetical protein
MCDKKIVCVIRGEREDANTRTRDWLCNRTQDADLGKRQGTQNAEASKGPLGLDVLGYRRLWAHDGEFHRSSRYGDERSALDPCGNPGIRFKSRDRKPFGE